jgi:hypothetical protein
LIILEFVISLIKVELRCKYEKGIKIKLFKTINEIYVNEGLGGFYKGYLPKLFKKAASGAITWGLYENLKKKNGTNNI